MPPVCGVRIEYGVMERTSDATAPTRAAATAPPLRYATVCPYAVNGTL